MYLKVSIVTPDCEEGTSYQHIVSVKESETPESTLLCAQYAIVDAVFTLYAHQNVISYAVEVMEDEPSIDPATD